MTNRKLVAIKLHLKALNETTSAKLEGSLTALRDAYTQAISFHFVLAHRAFLQEVASDYQISGLKTEDFVHLENLLSESGVVSQQCTMMACLEAEQGSWLQWVLELNKQYWQLNPSLEIVENVASAKATNSIAFDDVTYSAVGSRLQNSFDCLQDAVHQYRELMQEW
jgi:hypothetical protein